MRTYQPSDYKDILEWCFIRDINEPPQWALPKSGVIVDGIAVGFLILTNNHCGIIEYFISNPVSDKRERDKALDDIVVALLDIAKQMNVKMVTCNSQHPAIKDRAIKHGFNLLGNYTCFEKGI